MWWFSALSTLLLATALTGLPIDFDPDEELVLVIENTTLSTELKPPPINPDDIIPDVLQHGVVYVINLYALTDSDDFADSEEKLTNEVISSMPGILEPDATVMLAIQANDEDTPVNLDAIAKDLEYEGFIIKRAIKNGETKVIKVNFGDVADEESVQDLAGDVIKPVEMANKVRRKRAPGKKGKGKMMRGGGCGCQCGGCGGGGKQKQQQQQQEHPQQQAVPVAVIPVYVVPVEVRVVHEQPQMMGGCHECGGGGGGGGGGSGETLWVLG